MISATCQIVYGIDDGQSRTHISLKQEFYPLPTCRILQITIDSIVRRSSNLIGRYDADIVLQELLI